MEKRGYSIEVIGIIGALFMGYNTLLINQLQADLMEVKSDIKKIIESNADNKARITVLERELFKTTQLTKLPELPTDNNERFPKLEEMVAILNTNETNLKKYETLT